jgi:hypothetical protein
MATHVQSRPSSPSSSASATTLAKVASGQRLIIIAILLQVLSAVLKVAVGNPAGVGAALVGLVLAFVGLFQMAAGLRIAIGWRVLFAVLLLIPLVGLITLVALNSRATRALRAGGYHVGLLGASR